MIDASFGGSSISSLAGLLEIDSDLRDELETLTECPICRGGQLSVAYWATMAEARLKYDVCGGCGFSFQNPLMTQKVLTAIYDSHWYWGLGEDQGGYRHYLEEREQFQREYRRRFRKLASNGIELRGPLLDVGCGAGYSTRVAEDLGFEAQGVEPSHAMVDFATQVLGIRMHRGLIEDFNAKGQRFRVVSSWGTAHNFRDPVAAFGKMRQLLEPGGWLVTDFIDHSAWMSKGMDGHFRRTINATGRPTRRSFQILVERAGFDSCVLIPHFPYFSLSHLLRFLPIKSLFLRSLERRALVVPARGYYLAMARAPDSFVR